MAALCYSRDGTQYRSDVGYLPCNQTALANNTHSACCAVGDLCLTNGLCRKTFDDARRRNWYWQDGCTDPTWKDAACPKYCKTNGSDSSFVLNCLRPRSWCCNPAGFAPTSDAVTTCCDDAAANFTAPDPLVYATASLYTLPHNITLASIPSQPKTTIRPSAAFSTVSPADSPSYVPNRSPRSPGPSSASVPLKIGLGAGIPLGLAIVALLGAFACMLRRRQAIMRKYQDAHPELNGRSSPIEMAGNGTSRAQ